MPGHLSGIDAIAPAFERTKNQLFVPFRLRHWARLAVVCLMTGEITGGGGGWGGANSFHMPPLRGSRPGYGLVAWFAPGKLPGDFIAWFLVGLMALGMFVLVMIYVSSVFRFILFDAVLNNRCELGEGWRRWQPQGTSFFLWQIGFGLATLVAFGVVIGAPVFAAWREGLFRNPDRHFAILILGGLVVFCLFLGVVLLAALGSLFAKDFVVPVMALENRGVLDGWRRVLPMLGQEKGGYALYVAMKIVLAIGSALLFGIIDFFVILSLLIPLGIAGVGIFLFARGAGMSWNPLTIGAAVLAGAAAVTLLVFLISFVSSPAMVFFQAYSMHFFGSRYWLLGAALAPPQPPPPAMPLSTAPLPIT
jgi:MFS family permease